MSFKAKPPASRQGCGGGDSRQESLDPPQALDPRRRGAAAAQAGDVSPGKAFETFQTKVCAAPTPLTPTRGSLSQNICVLSPSKPPACRQPGSSAWAGSPHPMPCGGLCSSRWRVGVGVGSRGVGGGPLSLSPESLVPAPWLGGDGQPGACEFTTCC